MQITSHSWTYAPMLRRAYTRSTTQPELQFAGISKHRFRVPTISTLHPKKLVYSDFIIPAGSDRLSIHTHLSLHAPAKHLSNVTRLEYQTRRLYGAAHNVESEGDSATITVNKIASEVKRKSLCVPFPGYAQGFLYLHQPLPESGQPRAASSIRFRCAPSLVKASPYIVPEGTPKSLSEPLYFLPSSITKKEIYKAFNAGYDLTLFNGIPWGIPVTHVAARPSLEFIRLQLLEDKLFSKSEMEEYKDVYRNTSRHQRSNLLYTLNDMFPVRFDKTTFGVWTVTEKGGVLEWEKKKGNQAGRLHSVSRFMGVFMDHRTGYANKLPYTGAAHVRFELAPGSSISKPALSLRIVKITEPIKCVIPDYDGYINMPKEGKLFTHGLPGKEEPWICNPDPSVRIHSALLPLARAANANLS